MKLMERFYSIDSCTGIAVYLKADGVADIDLCTVTKRGDELDITTTKSGLSDFNDVSKHVLERQFISLNLSGKGVLSRVIPKIELVNDEVIKSLMPGLVTSDFYFQNFISGELSHVSLIRRADADQWINKFRQAGFMVMSLSLGPYPIFNIIPQLNVYENNVVINGNLITLNEIGDWLSAQYQAALKSTFPIKIGSEIIDEKIILAYAQAFQLILKDDVTIIESVHPDVHDSAANIFSGRKLRVIGTAILSIFFMLLLFNYLVLTSLTAENQRLQDHLAFTSKNDEDLRSIIAETDRKEALLKTLGWDGNITKAALVDQLSSLLPDGIKLKEIAVNPPDRQESSEQKHLVFKTKILEITGEAKQVLAVNEWIARMKTKKWVRSAALISFAYNETDDSGIFNIEITY